MFGFTLLLQSKLYRTSTSGSVCTVWVSFIQPLQHIFRDSLASEVVTIPLFSKGESQVLNFVTDSVTSLSVVRGILQ